MAKRFIDTEIFKDPFVRGLEAPLKTLWIYIFCDCDGAGLWPAELDVACMRLGIEVDEETIKKAFEKKIKVLDEGLTWFIPSFIRIQYNNCIKSNNKAFNQVIPKLLKYDLVDSETLTENNKTFTVYKLKEGASQGACEAPLEKDKDKEKEKEEEKDKEEESAREEKILLPFASKLFESQWDLWLKYKMKQFKFKYKLASSEQAALTELANLSGNDEKKAIKIIQRSMAHGWKGFFKLDEDKHGTNQKTYGKQAGPRQAPVGVKHTGF